MATATHPALTFQAIYHLAEQDYTTIKERLVRELIDIVSPTPTQEAAADQGGIQYFCYDDLYQSSTSTTPANNYQLGQGIEPGREEGSVSFRPPRRLGEVVCQIQHLPALLL